ncbi:hypothetical protein E8E12_011569 [Didymella heteroderae]|uniref:Uncharacterized protein n=1 Tax=Didymella heteroderae TaxID=1769908 RepID=A0A9P4X1F6_9PLEO|nr:hypothetical protein E8E12_011569 [Didymella heteroderae]
MDAWLNASPPAASEPNTLTNAPKYLPSGMITSPYPPPPAPRITTLAAHTSTPHAIIGDRGPHYLTSFVPNAAGIVTDAASLIPKSELEQTHPHLTRAWEAQQAHKAETSTRAEHKLAAFLRNFHTNTALRPPTPPSSPPRHRDVPCDLPLPLGLHRHWGALKPCAIHPAPHPAPRVCQGCRVMQHLALSHGDSAEMAVAASKGARPDSVLSAHLQAKSTGLAIDKM